MATHKKEVSLTDLQQTILSNDLYNDTDNAGIDKWVQDDSDGNGPYIAKWYVIGLAKPTNSQLNALDSSADTEETNRGVRATRKKSYGDIGDQLDLLYKDMTAGKLDSTGEWHKAIKKVKDDNPKS